MKEIYFKHLAKFGGIYSTYLFLEDIIIFDLLSDLRNLGFISVLFLSIIIPLYYYGFRKEKKKD